MRTLIVSLASLAVLASVARAEVLDRLRDDSGDVPGLPGWKIQRKADAKYCGGVAIITTAGKTKLSPEEQQLANVYNVTFPTNLSFSPEPRDNKVREASMKRFSDFVETMTKVGAAATKFYEETISKHASAEAKVRAAARIAQVQMRLASVIVRAEIPKDVRSGEFAKDKTEAFCDKLREVAEPLVVRAEEATSVCARSLADAPAGWWTTVCTAPPTPPTKK